MILRWTLIAVLVLTCFSSFAGCDPDLFTLDIVGGEETGGADVYINGERVGTMEQSGESSFRFVGRFPHGTLKVEVKKQGYTPYHETITVGTDEGERYVTLKLEKEKGS